MSGGGAASIGMQALQEVQLCHAFFVDWYAGRIDDAALAERLTAFSPDFLRIAPDGRLVAFADLRGFLESRRAAEAETVFSIAIHDGAIVWESRQAALVSYVEEQTSRGSVSRRRSTGPHGR